MGHKIKTALVQKHAVSEVQANLERGINAFEEAA